jgi:hypothetical protein
VPSQLASFERDLELVKGGYRGLAEPGGARRIGDQ